MMKDLIGKVHCCDCLEFMKQLPDKSIDLVLTDPPYGIRKAEWDDKYPIGYERECLRIGKTVAIMCGQWAIPICIKELGNDYIGIISMRNMNGMTYSPLGFGNWIPVIIAGKRPKSGQDCIEFVVKEEKQNHPSPKPIDCISKLVNRLSGENDLIYDCFLGSGTTALACERLERKWIGTEINSEYCKMAEERIKAERNQLKMDMK